MLRFLGEVNSHRKKGKARSAEKHRKKDVAFRVESVYSNSPKNERKQSSAGCTPSKKWGRPPKMQSLDQFLETMSTESSLYTTPSKPTIQYHRRHTPYDGWKSKYNSEEHGDDTLFTAERAFVQYKLGGWQSPSRNIEAAVTPCTESTYSSVSPSMLHNIEDRAADNFYSHQVFRSGWVKHPQVSPCKYSGDYSPEMFVEGRESHLDVQSTTSSEISWNYDSQAYHQKIASAIASDGHDCAQGKPFIVGVRNSIGYDEESVCSSVSSLYTSQNYQETPESNVSTWAPTCSPQDGVESLDHSVYVTYDYDGIAPQSCGLSGGNDSMDRENEVSLASNYDDLVSFSELISKCEEESLAERLAPYSSSPSKRQFGRVIDTNCSDSVPNSSTSDFSRSQPGNEESSRKPTTSGTKGNDRKTVTPKIRNTATNVSNHNIMIPNDAKREPENKVQTVEQAASTNGSSRSATDFPTIRSRFESKSLEYGMEPPVPRRYTRNDLQSITNVTRQQQESLSFAGVEACQSDEDVEEKDGELLFHGHDQDLQNKMIIGSSSSCHEEFPTAIKDCPTKTEQVSDENLLSTTDTIPRALLISQKQQNLQDKSNGDINPEKAFHIETDSAFSISCGHSGDSLVDLDKLSINEEPQREAILEMLDARIPEKEVQVHAPIEFSISKVNRESYYGPVDLDESISAWDVFEDDYRIVDVNTDLVEKTTTSTASASKQVRDSGKSNSPTHEDSMEQHYPVQHIGEPDYDDWEAEGDVDSLHFDELQRKVMALKHRQEQARLVSTEQHQVFEYSHETDIGTAKANTNETMSENRHNTTAKTSPLRRKMRVWKFFIRILKKKNKKELKDKVNRDLSTQTIDKLMLVSTDNSVFGAGDFADVSLLPLNQMEHLTKNTFHDGLRDQMLERLEWERKRQWIAEVDRDRGEWCEEMRASILKERELDRQLRLNSCSSDFFGEHGEALPYATISNEKTSIVPQQTNEPSDLKMSGIIDSCNESDEDNLQYSTPRSYLCEKSKVTRSTTSTRPLDSLESFSVNSFLHTDLSFASPETTSSLNSPRMTSTLPPCTLCKASERTHISLPCMHYSFCAECAEKLHGSEIPTCPICHTEHIALSRVYT